ncbi:hypothetical protein ACQEVG_38145 [Streptomyces sp. CA-135486]|uniref:hypothetical protein n=1 Tax=Streptomyces sp. CA-135486 TaxID=3240049 RepID=UPI003D8A4C66
MSENDFTPHQAEPDGEPPGSGAAQKSGGGWSLSRWRRGDLDRADDVRDDWPQGDISSPHGEESEPAAEGLSVPGVLTPGGNSTFTVNGNPDVVAAYVKNLILETRKRDVLEGVEFDRRGITEQPLVREGQWVDAWEQAIHPDTARLRQRVLIVVAPRSFGSTTFALHLLARHTDSRATLVKLDADWNTPSRGRLPLEEFRAFQLDLKDAVTDRLSADFLDALTKHSEDLEACNSYLVLTVAKELWDDHYLTARIGIHVVHLNQPPPAQPVMEAHLRSSGYPGLVPYVQSLDTTKVSLHDLDAVEAVRAAGTIVMAWQEHERLHRSSLPVMDPLSASAEIDTALEGRVTAALSDWRDKLDILFGEMVTSHGGRDTSLPLEDRCLLLALAVRQSAPMPKVAATARSLQDTIGTTDLGKGVFASPAQAVFAGRGLRRRIMDVGAAVDSHDAVTFDQPGYGRAILAYVWDNYEVMRRPLLEWLVQVGDSPNATDPAVNALATLTLRHGSSDYLNNLGSVARNDKSELLSAVMVLAVRDEHVGRLTWGTLYRWAGQQEYGTAVVSTCRRVLRDPAVTPSTAKMAMVRLRRVAHATGDDTIRSEVLEAFRDLAKQPTGTGRLVAEVQTWQQSKTSGKAGGLAFLALMSVNHDGMPWLMSDTAPDIDVERALQALLSDITTASEIIPCLTEWVRTSAADPTAYVRVRDGLIPPLRGQKMFKAGMKLMQALSDLPTIHGVNVAEDFYDHLVDKRVHKVFSLEGDTA